MRKWLLSAAWRDDQVLFVLHLIAHENPLQAGHSPRTCGSSRDNTASHPQEHPRKLLRCPDTHFTTLHLSLHSTGPGSLEKALCSE